MAGDDRPERAGEERRRGLIPPRDSLTAETWVGGAEAAIYVIAACLLLVAAGFTVVGTITDLIEGSKSRSIADAGAFLLDRILLLFIVAELLYTLRLVNLSGRMLVEPFLFIGLIAVVRKVIVITAEFQRGHQAIIDGLLEILALAGLALALALAIALLRGSAARQP